jgi:hypothetical protein
VSTFGTDFYKRRVNLADVTNRDHLSTVESPVDHGTSGSSVIDLYFGTLVLLGSNLFLQHGPLNRTYFLYYMHTTELERTKLIGKMWRSLFWLVWRACLRSHGGCHMTKALRKRSLDFFSNSSRDARGRGRWLANGGSRQM